MMLGKDLIRPTLAVSFCQHDLKEIWELAGEDEDVPLDSLSGCSVARQETEKNRGCRSHPGGR